MSDLSNKLRTIADLSSHGYYDALQSTLDECIAVKPTGSDLTLLETNALAAYGSAIVRFDYDQAAQIADTFFSKHWKIQDGDKWATDEAPTQTPWFDGYGSLTEDQLAGNPGDLGKMVADRFGEIVDYYIDYRDGNLQPKDVDAISKMAWVALRTYPESGDPLHDEVIESGLEALDIALVNNPSEPATGKLLQAMWDMGPMAEWREAREGITDMAERRNCIAVSDCDYAEAIIATCEKAMGPVGEAAVATQDANTAKLYEQMGWRMVQHYRYAPNGGQKLTDFAHDAVANCSTAVNCAVASSSEEEAKGHVQVAQSCLTFANLALQNPLGKALGITLQDFDYKAICAGDYSTKIFPALQSALGAALDDSKNLEGNKTSPKDVVGIRKNGTLIDSESNQLTEPKKPDQGGDDMSGM